MKCFIRNTLDRLLCTNCLVSFIFLQVPRLALSSDNGPPARKVLGCHSASRGERQAVCASVCVSGLSSCSYTATKFSCGDFVLVRYLIHFLELQHPNTIVTLSFYLFRPHRRNWISTWDTLGDTPFVSKPWAHPFIFKLILEWINQVLKEIHRELC